jgi:parvulin-like peptidyl-prolyl isomerase
VSLDQGRRKGRGGSGGAPGGPSKKGPVAARRLGLLVFGGAFVVLFVVVAIAVGIGHPSVPSGDVAYIEDAPAGQSDVTMADFKRGLAQAVAQSGQKKVPKPGDEEYEALKETAMNALLEPIWLQGLAEEEGITVSDKEVLAEFKKLKKENFKTEAEYKKFLKEANYTQKDVLQRVKLQRLSTELQAQLKENTPTPGKSEVEGYYEAAKATQFTQQPSRDIRLAVNKSKQKAEAALAALEKNDTAKNWKKVAKQYSEDPTTKESGGLRQGVTVGANEEPLDADIFGASEGQVIGPVKTKQGYTVFEVEKSTPEKVQPLKEVEAQIQSTLAQRAEQEYFTAFVSNFNSKWQSRTFCAAGYETERCANFKGSGHPSTAPEGCYEANPKGGLPEACPAPVFQLIPALPGSVTPLEPTGKPLAQRPRPAGEEKEEGAETELPPGVVPEEAPPAEEAPPPEESGE